MKIMSFNCGLKRSLMCVILALSLGFLVNKCCEEANESTRWCRDMSTPVTVTFIGKPIFYQREYNNLRRELLLKSNNHADFCGISGGWLLIFNMVIDRSGSFPPLTTQDDYRKISDFQNKALMLTNNALFELRKHLAFKQLRFHCYKPGVRTFHVVTIANSTGESVVRYFTGQVEEFPKASGSFTRLPGDNSLLALHPADWGYENGRYKVGKWSHQGRKALRDHAAFIQYSAHWLLWHSRWECDDYNTPTPPVGTFWKIYVRWVFGYTIVSVWDILKELTWTPNDCTFSMC